MTDRTDTNNSERLPEPAIPRRRALQLSRSRLPVASLRALARRALPVVASIATAAMATVAAERALARAVTRVVPREATPPAPIATRRRRIVVTERIQIERYRVRR